MLHASNLLQHPLRALTAMAFSFMVWATSLNAQLVINEVQYTNLSTLTDEDGDHEDWFELYNAGSTPVFLGDYYASDRASNPMKWALPSATLQAGEHKVIYASGKDRHGLTADIDHLEVAVYPWHIWRYVVPTAAPDPLWRNPGFDDSGWAAGPGGIGFGDGDDGTVVAWPAISVFSRTTFTLNDPMAVHFMVLTADYDDAFVCYLNGTEIARANIGTPGTPPAHDALADSEHEALEYQGLEPYHFIIPYALYADLLIEGENVLALQTHNVDYWSSDLTGNMRLVLGMSTPDVQTQAAPASIQFTLPFSHANFGLSSGETLVLSDASGSAIDAVELITMQSDHVLRRQTDGSGVWCVSDLPTPSAPNSTACYDGYAATPDFSTPAGFYPAAVYLALSSPDTNTEIRLTFDGGIPDQDDQLYSAPFAVAGNAVISARAFTPGKLPSHVSKNTYFINEDIVLPVVSLTTDPDNLWHPETGIHVFGPGPLGGYPYFGANFWQNWEREAFVEYFDETNIKRMEGPVGLKIHGGWSRAREQKSFRVQSKGKFGMETMNWPMIDDKPHISDFKGFNLRNGGNDYDNYRFHDALMERIVRTTHVDYMAYTPVVVFLNGEYWGFMELRENQDQHYITRNHNISTSDVTLVSWNYMGINVISGSMDPFYPMADYITQTPVDDPDYFATVTTMLDIENYIDYIITQTYWCNGDWSNGYMNNTKFWRDDREGGRWRFILMDLDFGMGLAGNSPNDDYIVQAGNDPFLTDQMFAHLKQNPTFRTRFINRYADLINTVFQYDHVQAIAYAMRDELEPEFQRHRNRWNTNGDALNGTLNWRLNWAQQRVQGARNVVQNHFSLPGQTTVTLDVQPAGAGRVTISTLSPDESEYPWSGVYFRGVPVNITAIEAPGYSFSHWANNDILPEGSNERNLEVNFLNNITFTAVFEGAPVETPLSITELMFNNDAQLASGDYLEIRNNLDVALNLSGWVLRDDNFLNSYTFPLNTLLEPHAHYVLASDFTAFTNAYPDVDRVLGPLNFSFGNSTDEVNLYRANGTPYIQFAYTDRDHPDLRCSDGCGHSRGHLGDTDDYSWEQWFLECERGSPGEAFEPCAYDVVLSEINYDSPTNLNPGDWYELFNPGAVPLDLSGWTYRDRGNAVYEFPSGTEIEPGGYLVVVRHPDQFNDVYPEVTPWIGPTGLSLANSNDMIKLYDASGTLHLAMRYFSSEPWPTEAAGEGKTLEYLLGSGHWCLPSSWFVGCDQGSPGGPYDPECADDQETNIQSVNATALHVWPNPATTTFTLDSGRDLIKAVTLYSADGRMLMHHEGHQQSRMTLDAGHLAPGTYVIVARFEGGDVARRKVMVYR